MPWGVVGVLALAVQVAQEVRVVVGRHRPGGRAALRRLALLDHAAAALDGSHNQENGERQESEEDEGLQHDSRVGGWETRIYPSAREEIAAYLERSRFLSFEGWAVKRHPT